MNGGLELVIIDDKGLQKSPYQSEIEPITKEERDAQVLARLGKKSVLEVFDISILKCACADIPQRRFGFISILGFTCTILITWEGSLMYVGPMGE